MKLRLLFIFVASISLHILYGQLTQSFRDLPQGNYTTSCRDIKMRIEGNGLDLQRVITAECQNNKGQWKKTTIKVPVMTNGADYTLHNDNGALKVDAQKRGFLPGAPIRPSPLY